MKIQNLTSTILAIALISATSHTMALEIDGSQSNVNLVSTKVLADGKSSVVEIFSFDSLAGMVNEDGTATVTIDLSDINTGIDIRDERMAEFLFDTENYPEATITAQIDDEAMAAGSHKINLAISVDMHGKQMDYTVPVLISANDSKVQVVTEEPFLVDASSFDLVSGLGKLGELAGLMQIPTTVPVTFSLSFDR